MFDVSCTFPVVAVRSEMMSTFACLRATLNWMGQRTATALKYLHSHQSRTLLPIPPEVVQHALPNFERPMMAGLMHDRTDFHLLLAVIENIPNTIRHVLLQQHPSPSSCGSYTSCPSAHLSLIVVTSPSLKESTVPLKPSSYVVVMVDPTCSLPFLDALSADYAELVRCRVVAWTGQVALYVQSINPIGW